MSALVDLLGAVALLAGGGFAIVGTLGLVRLPDFYSRIHAAGVTDTAGAGLIVLGLALHAGPSMAAVKLALVLAFMLFTGPVATHALAKAALHGRLEPLTLDERGRASSST